jgi:hypothetical protein
MLNADVIGKLTHAGRSINKVRRHISAITQLRDRTLQLATRILGTSSVLQWIPSGDGEGDHRGGSLQLIFTFARPDKIDEEVTVDGGNEGREYVLTTRWDLADKAHGAGVFNTQSLTPSDALRYVHQRSVLSVGESITIPRSMDMELVLPCILFRGHFDPFTIVRVTHTFYAVSLYTTGSSTSSSSSSSSSLSSVPVYCAEEIWDMCTKAPGSPLGVDGTVSSDAAVTPSSASSPRGSPRGPGNADSSGGSSSPRSGSSSQQTVAVLQPNMVLPMAYTPLLFSLYLHRSRLYHSAINTTGDLCAVTAVAYQFGKFYHDALFHGSLPWIDQALKAIVAYRFACFSHA